MKYVKFENRRQRLIAFYLLALVLVQLVPLMVFAQNLGGAPQLNKAVQGQTAAQPEGAFLNLVNWVGNVVAPQSVIKQNGAEILRLWVAASDFTR